MPYPIYSAPVRDEVTGEFNQALVGQQVQIVTRGTATPYPIQDAAADPIPDSLLTVQSSFCTPTFYIDTEDPTGVYLDWYDAGSGARGPVDFEQVLRELAQAAVGAVKSVNSLTPDETGNVVVETGGGGVTDHNQLSGLTIGDPHTQYDTPERSMDRHYTKNETGTLVANANAAASTNDRKRENHTGEQPISSVTNLESRLAALESGGTGGGITLIPTGTEPAAGSPPGIYGFIPDGPAPVLVETVSYDSEDTVVSCPVPDGAAVGDAVLFIPATSGDNVGSGNWTVSDSGWEELFDYSANQSRKTAAFVYRVTDSTALANLGAVVTANQTVTGRRCGVCFVIPGSLVAGAWPTYSSGSNRSAATLQSVTTEGWTIQGFSTATVPFHKVIAMAVQDAASSPSAAVDFTEVGWATGSSGGAVPITLTVLTRDLAATPIPAANVTHPTADSTAAGGGQFIIPVA